MKKTLENFLKNKDNIYFLNHMDDYDGGYINDYLLNATNDYQQLLISIAFALTKADRFNNKLYWEHDPYGGAYNLQWEYKNKPETISVISTDPFDRDMPIDLQPANTVELKSYLKDWLIDTCHYFYDFDISEAELENLYKYVDDSQVVMKS